MYSLTGGARSNASHANHWTLIAWRCSFRYPIGLVSTGWASHSGKDLAVDAAVFVSCSGAGRARQWQGALIPVVTCFMQHAMVDAMLVLFTTQAPEFETIQALKEKATASSSAKARRRFVGVVIIIVSMKRSSLLACSLFHGLV